jgi:hypothetical protein
MPKVENYVSLCSKENYYLANMLNDIISAGMRTPHLPGRKEYFAIKLGIYIGKQNALQLHVLYCKYTTTVIAHKIKTSRNGKGKHQKQAYGNCVSLSYKR